MNKCACDKRHGTKHDHAHGSCGEDATVTVEIPIEDGPFSPYLPDLVRLTPLCTSCGITHGKVGGR